MGDEDNEECEMSVSDSAVVDAVLLDDYVSFEAGCL